MMVDIHDEYLATQAIFIFSLPIGNRGDKI